LSTIEANLAPAGKENRHLADAGSRFVHYFFLCLFLRNLFLRLCVAIFLRLRFRPFGMPNLPFSIDSLHVPAATELDGRASGAGLDPLLANASAKIIKDCGLDNPL
jgi:hypothetical protein